LGTVLVLADNAHNATLPDASLSLKWNVSLRAASAQQFSDLAKLALLFLS
jgi:hypothetical protein